jgi:hypothetical protein
MFARTAPEFHTSSTVEKLQTTLRGSVSGWIMAWREARAAEQCASTLAESCVRREARARQVFETCYANAGTQKARG